MYIPKQYGRSRVDNCPFCSKVSTSKNDQGIPVCQAHKKQRLESVKCACGEWLDLLEGKWGPYFRCSHCGNISFKKGIEMIDKSAYEKAVEPIKESPTPIRKKSTGVNKSSERKEIEVTSDELDFLY